MKRIKTNIIMIFLIFLTGVAWGETNMNKNELTTVTNVNLRRYVGKWFEIAKIPNRFQKKCVKNTTAEYVLRDDGRITVINTCEKRSGDKVIAKGIAKIVDTDSNAKLKVSFVRFLGISLFWGNYWIIGLDKDYSYAVVGEPKRKYGWILARNPKLSSELRKKIEKILIENGYDPSRFVNTIHE